MRPSTDLRGCHAGAARPAHRLGAGAEWVFQQPSRAAGVRAPPGWPFVGGRVVKAAACCGLIDTRRGSPSVDWCLRRCHPCATIGAAGRNAMGRRVAPTGVIARASGSARCANVAEKVTVMQRAGHRPVPGQVNPSHDGNIPARSSAIFAGLPFNAPKGAPCDPFLNTAARRHRGSRKGCPWPAP
jgi:hypothetical protein